MKMAFQSLGNSMLLLFLGDTGVHVLVDVVLGGHDRDRVADSEQHAEHLHEDLSVAELDGQVVAVEGGFGW